MDASLQRRIDRCNTDFANVQGKPFQFFYCPILRRDEDVELCKGHVVNKRFNKADWVPQRADVDRFYGSIAEADFITVIENRPSSPIHALIDPNSYRQLRPRLETDGKNLDYYLTPEDSPHVDGYSRGTIVNDRDGRSICDITVKITPDELAAIEGDQISLVIEKDFQPHVTAATIKAAHLTLFKMLGYQHIFSPTGGYLADILREFFELHGRKPRKELAEPLAEYFLPWSRIVKPMGVRGVNGFQGTVADNHVLTCHGATEGIFAIGVIVKAGNDMFCVFVPTDDPRTIGTYFGFIDAPPSSIMVKTARFCPADERGDSRWETNPEEPQPVDLNEQLTR